ncbi:MAG: NUDIX domain-containing protein [Paenibacillus macerans]|nr:NUDIX domain-containing protein [Paenibacillus macerans]MCY7557865.1 NUDIX hydrolase [Paenibacillus macerans]MDU7476374.1 NUDIX domain-containing protein [Paenibacillus macerans]MEC0153444.1 NUDIX domain-containing protein [Paenibacillus macerans]UMV48628.1 NUDIX hydrolase [Paenibacillus macerans]GBK62253.1 NUDIX hydrolase [Paenibacillus macerans]
MDMLDRNGLTESEFLRRYSPGDYERPSVAADTVIFTVTDADADSYRKLPEKELRVLLIRRGGHPFLGQWALPGGFVRPDETTEQAAARELREETGVEDVYLEQLYTFSDVGRDPRTWVMSCSYMALVDSGQLQLQAGDDADAAAWFKVSYRLLRERKELIDGGFIKALQYELRLSSGEIELAAVVERTVTAKPASTATSYSIVSNDGLAFDHAKIIAYAIERLRGKVNYTDIALHLMPKLFTLTELQQVYEVILDKELLKAAFRRKVADLVTETDHYTENAGHRPSRLYRRNMEDYR